MFKMTSCAQSLFTFLCRQFPPRENEREEMQIFFGSHPLALLYQEKGVLTSEGFKKFCPNLSKEFNDISSDHSLCCKEIEEFVRKKYLALSNTQTQKLCKTIEKITRMVIRDVFSHIPQLINAMSTHGLIEHTQIISIDLWRNENHLYMRSMPYDLDRQELGCGEISYINGIMQTFENAKDDAKQLSDNLCDGANIHGIYSATHGAVSDLKILFHGQVGVPPEPVKHLLKQWNRFFQRELGSSKRYLQICMSQGVIMVKLALELLPLEYRKRICVLAIAPAGFIPSKDGCQVLHFVKMSDIVPVAMASGRGRLYDDDPEILKIADDHGVDPHNPHGQKYVDAMKPFVEKYIHSNTII